MSPEILNEAHKSNPNFRITEEECDRNMEKYLIFLRMEPSTDAYDDYPDEEEHNYYDDNLDMDQQSEEFYNTVPDYEDGSGSEDADEPTIEEQKAGLKQQLNPEMIIKKADFTSIPFKVYFDRVKGASVEIDLTAKVVKIFDQEKVLTGQAYFSKKLTHSFTAKELLNTEQFIRKRDYYIFDRGEKKILWSGQIQERIIVAEL